MNKTLRLNKLVWCWLVAFSLMIVGPAFGEDPESWLLNAIGKMAEPGTEKRVIALNEYIDMPVLAQKVFPVDFWERATPVQQKQLVDFLVLLIAEKMPIGRGGTYKIVGKRQKTGYQIVAIRFIDEIQYQETWQFEIVSDNGAYLIQDIRSEKGRLSSRLKKHIETKAKSFFTPPDPAGFLAAFHDS